MHPLAPLQWTLWLAVLVGQIALAVRMIAAGSWRRWPSLFCFITILSCKDAVRVANAVTARNPYVDFWTFWLASFAAEIVEVWIMVEITNAAVGISRVVRAILTNGIVAIAATSLTGSAALAMNQKTSCVAQFCYVARRLDSAVAIAWLVSFILVATGTRIFADWPDGMRGIVIGFSLELTAASYLGWWSAQHGNADLSNAKSAIYLISLILWAASTASPSPLAARKQTSSEFTLPSGLDVFRRGLAARHRGIQ